MASSYVIAPPHALLAAPPHHARTCAVLMRATGPRPRGDPADAHPPGPAPPGDRRPSPFSRCRPMRTDQGRWTNTAYYNIQPIPRRSKNTSVARFVRSPCGPAGAVLIFCLFRSRESKSQKPPMSSAGPGANKTSASQIHNLFAPPLLPRAELRCGISRDFMARRMIPPSDRHRVPESCVSGPACCWPHHGTAPVDRRRSTAH